MMSSLSKCLKGEARGTQTCKSKKQERKEAMKRKSAWKIVVLIFTVICIWGSSCIKKSEEPAGRQETTFENIQRTGLLNVGYIPYPPAVIKDETTGEVSGDFVELARYIANELDLKLVFHEVDWSNFATGLENHQYDLSISCTYIKVGRAAKVAFSRPIAYLGQSAGVRKNDRRFDDVRDVMEFDRKGIVVAVVSGESSHEYVKSNFKNATIRELSGADLTAPLALVASGQADVAMTDAYVTRKFCEQQPEIRDVFAENPYDLSPMAWAVRPTDFRLLNFINNAIETCEASGKLRKWSEKYDAHWVHKSPSWTTW
jgi:ABC-type amino acid transport substrate-binding protein